MTDHYSKKIPENFYTQGSHTVTPELYTKIKRDNIGTLSVEEKLQSYPIPVALREPKAGSILFHP